MYLLDLGDMQNACAIKTIIQNILILLIQNTKEKLSTDVNAIENLYANY